MKHNKIIEAISMHFQNNTVTVNQKDGVFCLNDLHKAYTGGKSRAKKPNDWTKNLNGDNSRLYNLATFKGKYGGTYANEQGVYAYAAWLDAEFHAAVLDTFAAAARGDGKEAVKIAQSAVTLEFRKYLRESSPQVNDAIYTATKEGTVKGGMKFGAPNIRSVICKAVTGIDGTAFKARYGMSARDFLAEQDDWMRLNHMTGIEGLVRGLLKAGMSYEIIKAALAADIQKAQEDWPYPIPQLTKKAKKEAA